MIKMQKCFTTHKHHSLKPPINTNNPTTSRQSPRDHRINKGYCFRNRGSPLFYWGLRGVEKNGGKTDLKGFLRIFLKNVLPLFYRRGKMFYQMGILTF